MTDEQVSSLVEGSFLSDEKKKEFIARVEQGVDLQFFDDLDAALMAELKSRGQRYSTALDEFNTLAEPLEDDLRQEKEKLEAKVAEVLLTIEPTDSAQRERLLVEYKAKLEQLRVRYEKNMKEIVSKVTHE